MLSRERFSSVNTEHGWRKIRSASTLYLSSIATVAHTLEVHADELIVDREIYTGGQSVHICCRKLVFLPGSKIDTTGVNAYSHPENIRPIGSLTPGDPGPDGAPGAEGFRGGDVFISAFLIEGTVKIGTHGGKGGRGQDGGDGQPGETGTPCGEVIISGEIFNRDNLEGIRGGKGSRGGSAGLPGMRGRGGDAGNVFIYLLDTSPDPEIGTISMKEGEPGDPANKGAPGQGGKGGEGGVYKVYYCYTDPYLTPTAEWGESLINPRNPNGLKGFEVFKNHRLESFYSRFGALENNIFGRRTCYWGHSNGGPEGHRGDVGDDRNAEAEERRKPPPVARPGTLTIEKLSAIDFSRRFSVTFFGFLSSRIDYDLIQLGGAATPSDFIDRVSFVRYVAESRQADLPGWRNAYFKACCAGSKVASGLDFFGYTADRVPFLSYEMYSQTFERSIQPILSDIESNYFKAWDADYQLSERKSAIRGIISQNENLLVAAEQEVSRVEADARRNLQNLPLLEGKMAANLEILMAREEELNSAIASRNDQCDLIGTITAVAVIVAGVSSGGAGFVAAAGSGKQLYDDFSKYNDSLNLLWDNRRVFEQSLKLISSATNDVAQSIRNIQGAMNTLGGNDDLRLPKFVMERAHFDQIAKEFLDVPEASAYRQAGYDYLASVEARNQAIVDYNALLIQLISIESQKSAIHHANAIFKDQLSGLFDPDKDEMMNLLTQGYLDGLMLAARVVHAEAKALGYLLGEYRGVGISTFSASTIGAAHLGIKAAWLSAKEAYRPKRKLRDLETSINLRKLVDLSMWEYFKQTGQLTFCIRKGIGEGTEQIDQMPNIRLTGLVLELPGVRIKGGVDSFGWNMRHSGVSLVHRATETLRFVHPSVLVGGFCSRDGEGVGVVVNPDVSEEGKYAGLSPYCTWTLQIKDVNEIEADLSNITDARIRINGYYFDE